MQANVKFSSKRFLLTLMLCACSVILLQNYDLSENSSFTLNVICVFAGLAVCLILLVPAIIIKCRTDSDFLTIAHQRTPRLSIPIAVIYAVYFIYSAEFFLLPYTDMFHKKYFPDASPCIISFLLLAACVYAAYKGTNVITRFGIFLFVFAMLTNFLMFGGSLSSLDFEHYGFELSGSVPDLVRNTMYFITPSFIAVIFACLSGYTKNFKVRQPVFALALTGIKYSLVIFFISFALGDYAFRQEYQTFVLSRVAHFARYGGIESFYLALATMSVFMIISLLLCCTNKSVGKNDSMKNIIIFTGIIFVIHILAEYNPAVRELFTNTLLFVILTAVAAAVIPAAYIFLGDKSNAKKNQHNIIVP